MAGRIRKRFESIIKHRAEYSSHVTLSHKKIYIIPSKLSLMLLVVISLIVLAGINYQNNVFYIIAFWLLSLFIWNFILTFLNLSKLEINAGQSEDVFSEDTAQFNFILKHPKKNVHGLTVRSESDVLERVFVEKKARTSLYVNQKTTGRGRLNIERLTFSTVYPFGFAYGFSYVYLDSHLWVYPKPINANVQSVNVSSGDQESLEDTLRIGSEDFNQLKEYQSGERLGHIHWANYAKTGELKIKEFVDVNASDHWIDWSDFPMLEIESRLSHLCFLIMTAYEKNENFGLRLPNIEIEPVYQSEKKKKHLNECLLQLAKH